MKVYPVMLLKTNGGNIARTPYPVMLMKTNDLQLLPHDVDDNTWT